MKRTMKFSVNGPTSTLLLHPASPADDDVVADMRRRRIHAITSFDEFDYICNVRLLRVFHLVFSVNFFAHESSDNVITKNIKQLL